MNHCNTELLQLQVSLFMDSFRRSFRDWIRAHFGHFFTTKHFL